jgi:hypothetical protein
MSSPFFTHTPIQGYKEEQLSLAVVFNSNGLGGDEQLLEKISLILLVVLTLFCS